MSIPSNPTVGGTCRLCGCTDLDCTQCIARTGRPCSWADRFHDLCTACQSLGAPRRKPVTVTVSPHHPCKSVSRPPALRHSSPPPPRSIRGSNSHA